MKKKNINPELAFKKLDIVELNDHQLQEVNGGTTAPCVAASAVSSAVCGAAVISAVVSAASVSAVASVISYIYINNNEK